MAILSEIELLGTEYENSLPYNKKNSALMKQISLPLHPTQGFATVQFLASFLLQGMFSPPTCPLFFLKILLKLTEYGTLLINSI